MKAETIDTTKQVKQAELAKILGLSRQYISKLAKQGKLEFDAQGRIVVAEAMHQIEASKDYRRDSQRAAAERNRQGTTGSPGVELPPVRFNDHVRSSIKHISVDDVYLKELPHIPSAPDENDAQDSIGGKLQQALCAKMIYDAQLRMIEYLEASGSLLQKDDVLQGLSDIAVILKTKLEGMPKKLGPMLAGKQPAQIESLIRRECETLLHELNKQLGKVHAHQA